MTPSLIFLFLRAHFWENNDDRQGCMDKDRCIYHYHRRLSPIHPGLIARTSHIFPNIHSYPRPACSRNPSKFHARRRHGAWIFWLQNSHQPTQQTKKKNIYGHGLLLFFISICMRGTSPLSKTKLFSCRNRSLGLGLLAPLNTRPPWHLERFLSTRPPICPPPIPSVCL